MTPGSVKLRRGEGPRRSVPERSRSETLTVVHLCVFLVLTSWYFGGAAPSAAFAVSLWGSLGIVMIALIASPAAGVSRFPKRALLALVPLLLLNAISLVSMFFRDVRMVTFDGQPFYSPNLQLSSWMPACVEPLLAFRGLWIFDAIYLSCFNLLVLVKQRRLLRLIFGVGALNAVAIAIFGTLQKLGGATGLFFNAVPSPQKYFFGSFVYDNHWASFAVLMSAAAGALLLRFVRRSYWPEVLHTPAPATAVGLVALLVSVPLSGSRAGTLLMSCMYAVIGVAWLSDVIKSRRRHKESIAIPLSGAIATVALTAACAWFVAGSELSARLQKTEQQVSEARATGSIGNRAILYHDTFRMGKDRPLFGWGINSYQIIFGIYNTSESKADKLPVYFHDAHSDWLQAFAERGIVGAVLLALSALLPLVLYLRWKNLGTIPAFLLCGCVLILAYAMIEFPFGNPAVLLAWWLCFFGAVRYTSLESAVPKP